MTLVILDKKAWGKDLKAGQGYGPGSAAPVQSIGDKLAAKVVAQSQKLVAAVEKPKSLTKKPKVGGPLKSRNIGKSPTSGFTIKGWRFGDEVLSIEKGDTPGHEFHGNQYTEGDRVETHPATDRFMRGDRYGTVTSVGTSKVHVKLDRSGQTVAFHPKNIISLGEKDPSFVSGASGKASNARNMKYTGVGLHGPTGGTHSHEIAISSKDFKREPIEHTHAPKSGFAATHQLRIEHQDAAMPPAIRDVMNLKKGDVPGHEFHGNQYGEGSGGSHEHTAAVQHGSSQYAVMQHLRDVHGVPQHELIRAMDKAPARSMEVRHESGRPVASKSPSMTSRDYRHLADGVARSPLDDKTKAEFAAHLAASLYKTNSRFDGARFAAAAKGTPNKPGDKPRGRDYRSGDGMTRGHFKLIADAIKTFPLKDEATRTGLADHFAGHLGTTNPRFDKAKFFAASQPQREVTKYEVVQLIEKGDLPGHEFHGNQWSTFAGGIGSPNKYSYMRHDSRGGQYHVAPVTSSTGRHQGYSLTRAAGPHPSEGPGLWRTIDAKGNEKHFVGHEPAFRSPQAAKSAAKLHESKMTGGAAGARDAYMARVAVPDRAILAQHDRAVAREQGSSKLSQVVSSGLDKPGAKWTPETGWTDKPVKK